MKSDEVDQFLELYDQYDKKYKESGLSEFQLYSRMYDQSDDIQVRIKLLKDALEKDVTIPNLSQSIEYDRHRVDEMIQKNVEISVDRLHEKIFGNKS